MPKVNKKIKNSNLSAVDIAKGGSCAYAYRPSPYVVDLRNIKQQTKPTEDGVFNFKQYWQEGKFLKPEEIAFWPKLISGFKNNRRELKPELHSQYKEDRNQENAFSVFFQLSFVNFIQLFGFFIYKIFWSIHDFYARLANFIFNIPDALRILNKKSDTFKLASKEDCGIKLSQEAIKNIRAESSIYFVNKDDTVEDIADSIETLYGHNYNEHNLAGSLASGLSNIPQKLNLQPYWLKNIVVFAILSLIFILPIKAATYIQKLSYKKELVLNSAEAGIKNLKLGEEAVQYLDIGQAFSSFDSAFNNFEIAEGELDRINLAVRSIVKLFPQQSGQLDSAQNIIASGKNISLAADYFTRAISALNNQINFPNALARINAAKINLILAEKAVAKAVNDLEDVGPEVLPPIKREGFKVVKENLPLVQKNTANFISILDSVDEILGSREKKKYLVIFQNSNEIRATGGFLGSFAVVDIEKGKITRMEIPPGGSYDLQGKLTKYVASPKALHIINPRFEFQDSNWFPDFPTSAEKMQWFYENSGGPTVDGVIALNSKAIEDMLKSLGPIDMPEYGITVDGNNFVEETQKIVESPAARVAKKPKQFIADLAPRFIEKIIAGGENVDFVKLVSIINSALNKKNIMFYFNDWKLEQKMKKFGWAGDMRHTSGDYLMIVHSTVAGGKSEGVISTKAEHHAEIQDDGRIIDNLIIKRTHLGSKNDNLAGVNSIDYMRVYVPRGSLLLSAEGFTKIDKAFFETPDSSLKEDKHLAEHEKLVYIDSSSGTEIYESFAKTMFAGFIELNVGETVIVNLRYELPFRIFKADNEEQELGWIQHMERGFEMNVMPYSIFIQKQPGHDVSEFLSSITMPEKFRAVWHYPPNLKIYNDKQYIFNTELDSDKFYGLALEEK